MPYIKQDDRERLLEKGERPQTAGELNYILTTVCLAYLVTKGESYQTYNDILGALSGCTQELYRRNISVYENKKIAANGDVY